MATVAWSSFLSGALVFSAITAFMTQLIMAQINATKADQNAQKAEGRKRALQAHDEFYMPAAVHLEGLRRNPSSDPTVLKSSTDYEALHVLVADKAGLAEDQNHVELLKALLYAPNQPDLAQKTLELVQAEIQRLCPATGSKHVTSQRRRS